MSQPPTRSRVRLVASAGLLASAAAVVAVTGAGPVPSLFQLSSATHGTSDVDPSGSDDASSTNEILDATSGVDDQGVDATDVDDDATEVDDDDATDTTIDDDATEVDDDDATEVDDDDDATDTTLAGASTSSG